MEKKMFVVDKQVRKKTIAEMLQKLDPNHTMPNEIDDDSIYPPLAIGLSRKRSTEQRKKEQQKYSDVLKSDFPKSPPRKIKPPSDPTHPPGFINPNGEYKEITDSIVEFIKSFITGMELPGFVMSIIDSFVIPRIHKIVTNLINSVCQKMNESVWLSCQA
jgi:hypothetical protein